MSNTGFKGIDVRQTGSALVFRAFMQTSAGAKETAGPVTLALYEIQNDGTFKSYDFNDNTFKTTALTTATASMTHQKGNNAAVNTGVWTYALSTLTGFTVGAVYLAQANDASASPTDQTREFQYGSEQGDLVTLAGATGQAYLETDAECWKGVTISAPATAGVPDVNVKNYNNQTAATGADNLPKVSLWSILGSALTGTASQIASAFSTLFNVVTPTLTCADVNQTGDSYARIGATGSGLTSLAPAATALSTAQWTNARAGYLDNLNVGGNVASHADILAINQSASKHLLLVTVAQYEPGETYTVEARTYQASDGSAVNADTTPTLTATGQVSGSLNANLSGATNPATGVYRWTYTPGASPTLEQIRFDLSATINSSTFTLATYAQTIDEATAVFTATDQSHLTSIFNKLPTNNIADETLLLAAIGTPAQASVLGTPAGASIAADIAAVKTDTGNLVTRIPAALFSGMTSLAQWLGLIAGKQTGNATARTELRATGSGSGTYDETADSLEAIRARGDTGWITATGFSTPGTPQTIDQTKTLQANPAAGTIGQALQVIVADQYSDETTDPTQWHTVFTVAGSGAPGTGVTLMTKKLWDTAGTKVTANTQVIGQASQ